MDLLSDVLSLLKLRSYMSGGFTAGGQWSLKFERQKGIRFYALVEGQCWLAVEGVPEPVLLKQGDCLLLPLGFPFRVASDLALDSVDAVKTIPVTGAGGTATYNGGGDFFCIGGYFTVAGDYAGVLMDVLPPLVIIRKEGDKAILRWCLERMRHEIHEPQPGSVLVVQQLATMVLVQALRLHLAEGLKGGTAGWLFALADRQMATVIAAIHQAPDRRWNLVGMAEQAGMSRTAFAIKFKAMVGVAPMEYLTRWRMTIAKERLESSTEPMSAIALKSGYESVSAFSTAFKRVTGYAPRFYARTAQLSSRKRTAP